MFGVFVRVARRAGDAARFARAWTAPARPRALMRPRTALTHTYAPMRVAGTQRSVHSSARVGISAEKFAQLQVDEAASPRSVPSAAAAARVAPTPKPKRERNAEAHALTPDNQLQEGRTPLHEVILAKDENAVLQILAAGGARRGKLLLAADEQGRTPLHYAAQKSASITRILLGAGADVNAGDRTMTTPLHLAVLTGKRAIVNALLEAGALPNVSNEYLETPLHYAAEQDNPEITRALTRRGRGQRTNTEAKEALGLTPLHLAVLRGSYSAATVLLQVGANASATNIEEITPLHSAAEAGDVAICRLLLSHGAEINAEDIQGNIPLHYAMQAGPGVVKLLINKGAAIDRHNMFKRTPTHYAAVHSNVDALDMLEHEGAVLDMPDTERNTPLHLAAMQGDMLVIDRLLKLEAEADVRNTAGKTPADLAQAAGHSEAHAILTSAIEYKQEYSSANFFKSLYNRATSLFKKPPPPQ